MGHGDKGPPEISLERLRSLPDEERAGCWKSYKNPGGKIRMLFSAWGVGWWRGWRRRPYGLGFRSFMEISSKPQVKTKP